MIITTLASRIIGQDLTDKWLERAKRIVIALAVFYESAFLFGWVKGLILAAGFVIWRYDGWGEQNLAMTGDFNKYASRNRDKYATQIADKIFPVTKKEQVKKYGIIWGGIRGLYDMPTYIGLAIALSNPWAWIMGLFMGTQGFIYYICGEKFEVTTQWPEYAVGALRTVLILSTVFLFS